MVTIIILIFIYIKRYNQSSVTSSSTIFFPLSMFLILFCKEKFPTKRASLHNHAWVNLNKMKTITSFARFKNIGLQFRVILFSTISVKH